MKVAGINAPLGTIAWVDGHFAGVAFEGTMHPAVLDHLFNEGVISNEERRFYRSA
jgi:hypothetical protein